MRMQREQWKTVAVTVGVTVGVYIGIKYVLPLVLPFFCAFLAAYLLRPLVRKIHVHTKLNCGVIAGGLLLTILGVVGLAVWFLGSTLLQQFCYFLEHYAFYVGKMETFLEKCCQNLSGILGMEAAELETVFMTQMGMLAEKVEGQFVPKLMVNSWTYARTLIEVAGVSVIIFVSIILFVNDFDKLKEKASHWVGYGHAVRITKRIFHMGGMFLKAQLVILSVIATLCTVTFLILKNPYALLLGILIGFLDALPVFGTAVVLYPLAAVQAFQGHFLIAAVYIGLSVLCNITREFLEPKLIGEHLGIPAIMVLVTVYTGIRLFGISGVITGPFGYLAGREIIREVIKKDETEEQVLSEKGIGTS